MATTFTVFSLGNLTDIDTTEGNTTAENANALVGMTFGSEGDALVNQAQTFSVGSTGYTGGTSTAYDQDNSPAETFRINGGANQTFDSSVVYNATITYVDGSTASITAVVFQDTNGNTYWAPEFSANADQTAMEAQAIRSLSLDSLSGASYAGMTGDRQAWDYVTCYVRGTLIMTDQGERPIEQLAAGDFVQTRDNGLQQIRWIGSSAAIGMGKLAPVRIARGALGADRPIRDLYVSRQHRMLLQSKIAERMFGSREVLIPAIKLTAIEGIDVQPSPRSVTYFHLMTDRHEIIFADGCQSETLLTGPQARKAMGPEAVEELETLFPEVMVGTPEPARPIFQSGRLQRLFDRHLKNDVALTSAQGMDAGR
jgi:hypothetical protein